MQDNIIGTAVYKLTLQTDEAKQGIKDFANEAANSLAKSEKRTTSLANGMGDLALGINNLRQSFSGLSAGASVISDLIDNYNRYQASMNGVAAVARATGNDVSASMTAVKDSIADGLLSQSDAAAAVKNLEAYGYTADQAAEMIKVMTDAAVYNRQANYSVSEAVRVTTEGIRMENSVLSDAAGINKNIAKMQEEYAKELGTTANNLTDAQKAQAVYNGVMAEGGIYTGNAKEYTQTLAGAQNKLSTAIDTTKANLGALFDSFAPVINGLADWISENQGLIAGITTFVGILAGAGGLIGAIVLAKKAVDGIRASLAIFGVVSKAAAGGLAGLAVGIATIGGAVAAATVLNNLADSETKLDIATNGATATLEQQSVQASNTAKNIAKLQNQISNLTRDYERDLKQIAVNHEDNLATLQTQIEEANIDYQRAIDERMASFNVTMAKQERSHQETVDELMGQLAFLQRYNNDYNKQKLAQVEFALAKEQALYQRETEAQQAEIDLQNQADQEKLNARLSNLQAELDEELAFMNKHREDLNAVRHVILLDEIESLKERYAEQKKSYEEQIAEAGAAGTKVGDDFSKNIDKAIADANGMIKRSSSESGSAAGTSFVESAAKNIVDGLQFIPSFFDSIGQRFYNLFNGNGFSDKKFSYVNGQWRESGYASGGYTGRGDPNEVAGVVHKGEYVIPASQVNQNTGLPKTNPGGGDTFIINMSGILATSDQAKRELAADLKRALAQTKQARLS